MIHIYFCRCRTNIPSPVSDKVFHAVVKPRTVKHMKVGYHYTGYQIVEHRSSWNGPDTSNVSNVGNSDHGSILIQEAESRLYSNRTDIKGINKSLIDDENFPAIVLKE